MKHVEVKVLVPESRVEDFYATFSRWLSGSPAPAAGASSTRPKSRRGRESSYAALGDHLDESSEPVLTMSFDEIEDVIGRPLPASAYRHRAWWANTESHSQAAEWLRVGWRAAGLDLERQTVSFEQMS